MGSDISSHREGGTATRCSSRPTAHPDRTGGPDTQRRRRRAANRSAGAPGSGLARKLLPAPRVPPPPPPPSLLLRRRQPRRLAPGCACVLVIYLFSEHASRFFFYSWGRGGGWGGEAHASTHPGTDTGRRAMEPPRAHTRSGLRPITWGGPGAREERQGRGCQRRQPRLGFPVVERRLPLRPPLLSPRRSSPGAAGAAAAVDVPPPRSSANLLCLAAPLLLHAQATAAKLGGHSPGHNLASAAAPAAATTAPASASSPSSSPPPPPAPWPPPPRGPPSGPPPRCTPRAHWLGSASLIAKAVVWGTAPPPALFSSGCQSVLRACRLHRPVTVQVSLEWAGRREAGLRGGARKSWAAECPPPRCLGPAHTPGCVAAAASVCVARSSEFGDPRGRKKERRTLPAAAQLPSLPQLSREARQGRRRVNSLPWGGSSAWVRWTGVTDGGVVSVRAQLHGKKRKCVWGAAGRGGWLSKVDGNGLEPMRPWLAMLSDPGRPRR